MLDILRKAFPGRVDKQIIPIGLVYAGIRWGKDYRYGEVPKDKYGSFINSCSSEERYWEYLGWLADYLYNNIDAESNEEQQGLCKYLDHMVPEDGIQLIAMNSALYQVETEPMESWIENKVQFAEYSKNIKEYFLKDGEKYDEKAESRLYERVQKEINEQKRYCPDVQHADVPYRVPLSRVLKKEEIKEKRISLLDLFYQIYDEYMRK